MKNNENHERRFAADPDSNREFKCQTDKLLSLAASVTGVFKEIFQKFAFCNFFQAKMYQYF